MGWGEETVHKFHLSGVEDRNFQKNLRQYLQGMEPCLDTLSGIMIRKTGKEGEYLVGIPEEMVRKTDPGQIIEKYFHAYRKAPGYQRAKSRLITST